MLNNLISIQEKTINNNIINTVNARELYKFLECKRQFADWIKDRLQDFVENQDYITISQIYEGLNQGLNKSNNKIECFIILETAKHISMIERNEKGKQARQYFIDCEKKLKNQTQTPKIDSKFLLQISQQLAELENTIKEQKPKIDFYDTVLKSKDFIEMSEVAKCINKKIGRNKLFKILRDKQILRFNNEPYQEFVNRGFFKIETNSYTKNNETKIYLKTVISQKGLEYINNIVDNYFNNL